VRIAVVHDWLTGMRGGEKVLEAIFDVFPSADLFTLVQVAGTTSPAIERRRVVRSPLQWLPGVGRLYRQYLPLFPFAVEQFDLDDYDLVVSSSHCAAKSVVVPGRGRHLCYCHTPMRYGWDRFPAYFGPDRVGPRAHQVLRHVMAHLARWDRETAGRVHRYLANSQYVARRIAVYYNRQSTIVHPPVDTVFYTPAAVPVGSQFLMVSALVRYKRVELAIAAAREAGVPLTIVGEGPERADLQALAGDDVKLIGWQSDEDVRDLYRTSLATVLPGEEDFGIVPVEAQACGRPVVALGVGGALDTVMPGVTGVLFDEPSVSALAGALLAARNHSWNSAAIRRHAERFSRKAFTGGLIKAADELMAASPDELAAQPW
jgi:glycosyltransferase involved in cell wall biosynthesis